MSDENPYFKSDEGILYNKNKSIVLFVPEENQKKELTFDDSVSEFAPGALSRAKNVKKFDEQFSYGYCEGGGPHYFGVTSIKTVKGYKGTVAESFAKENNFEFVPLG